MSTRVDFYLIDAKHVDGRLRFACRIIEKAYRHQHKIFILCEDSAQANTIDELLWIFADTSFVPHNFIGEGPTPPPPVQIGTSLPQQHRDILVLLCNNIPAGFERFNRIIEVIHQEESVKNQAREHYRSFRSQGCVLKSHDLQTSQV